MIQTNLIVQVAHKLFNDVLLVFYNIQWITGVQMTQYYCLAH